MSEKINCVIHWIEANLEDSTIQSLNNWGQAHWWGKKKAKNGAQKSLGRNWGKGKGGGRLNPPLGSRSPRYSPVYPTKEAGLRL